MEYKDFKIGKKYKHPIWSGTLSITCVGFTTSGVPIMETYREGNIFRIIAWENWRNFIEYRECQEPREYWIVQGTSFVHPNLDSAKLYRSDRLLDVAPIIHVREVLNE